MNTTISYANARQNLKHSFDKVCDEKMPIRVERRNGDNVVIISEDDFRSIEETAYLFKSPKNAQRLLESLGRDKEERIDFKDTNNISDAIGI